MIWLRDDSRWLREVGPHCIHSADGYAVSWVTVAPGKRQFCAWRSVGAARGVAWSGWKVSYALGERVPSIRFDLLEVFEDVGAARAFCERHFIESEGGGASV